MDLIANCRRATAAAVDMISSVQADEWDAATPCEGWDARTLVSHMIGTCASFVGGLRKATADDTPALLDLGDDDPTTTYERADAAMSEGTPMGLSDVALPDAYRHAAAALLAELEAPGALEKIVYLSFSELPGPVAVRVVTADALIHTWDLAKALGRPFSMDEETAAASLELMQQFYNPEQRGPGKAFGHAIPCPETAPVQDRLIALSGRQP